MTHHQFNIKFGLEIKICSEIEDNKMRVYQYMNYVLLKHNLIRKLTAVLILLNPPGTLYFCYKGHFLEHEEQYIATLSQSFFLQNNPQNLYPYFFICKASNSLSTRDENI